MNNSVILPFILCVYYYLFLFSKRNILYVYMYLCVRICDFTERLNFFSTLRLPVAYRFIQLAVLWKQR